MQQWTYQQSAAIYGEYRLAHFWVEAWKHTREQRAEDYEAAAHLYWQRKLEQATQAVRAAPAEIPGCNVWACHNAATEDGLCQPHREDGRHEAFRISHGFQAFEPVVITPSPSET